MIQLPRHEPVDSCTRELDFVAWACGRHSKRGQMRPRPERPAESEARRGGRYVSGTYALCGPGRADPPRTRMAMGRPGPHSAYVRRRARGRRVRPSRELASQCAALPAPVGVSPRSARGCAPAVRVTVTCRSSPRRQFKSEINPKSANRNPGNRAPGPGARHAGASRKKGRTQDGARIKGGPSQYPEEAAALAFFRVPRISHSVRRISHSVRRISHSVRRISVSL